MTLLISLLRSLVDELVLVKSIRSAFFRFLAARDVGDKFRIGFTASY